MKQTRDRCSICTHEWDSTGKDSPLACPNCGSEDIEDANTSIYDDD